MQTSLLKKEKNKRIERSLKINLKKRKIFQNKIKKKIIISK
jgi:hypothetical protein|tara:strand:+ start:428 stop:550 length:123 start_codon:yes stop_codon:yes gene_type:complete